MPKEVLTDEALMERYQEGDSAAFQALYERYSEKVYGYLHKRIPQSAQADELFQLIFLKFHQSRHQYQSSKPFAPWFFSICRSVLIDAIRKGEVYSKVQFTPIDEVVIAAPEIEAPTPAYAATTIAAPTIDIDSLAPEEKQLVLLRYEEGLSFEQISSQLKVSAAALRKRMSRLLARLRKGGES